MATQWPLVRGRLLNLLPTLTGWDQVEVVGGTAVDTAKALICTVGHATDGTTSTAGNYTTAQAPDGFQYVEQGALTSQLSSFDSTVSIEDNLTTLFALLDQVDAAIRADRRLGVLSPAGYADMTVDVSSAQSVPGAFVSLTFSINYYTVT